MELSDQIIKVLDALSEKIGVAIDWSSNNVLPYLQQLCSKYVNYRIAISVMWLVIGIATVILGTVIHNKLKKNKEFGIERYTCLSDDHTIRILSYIGVYGIYFIAAVIIVLQVTDVITCLTFPEKVIIDKLLPLIQ